MSVAVRRPARRDLARVPERAVVGLGSPLAVHVQILVARHVGRDVGRRAALAPTLVAREHPAIEPVVARGLLDELGRVGAEHEDAPPGAHADAAVVGADARLASEDGDASLEPVGIDVDSIAPVLANAHARVRGPEGEALVVLVVAYAHSDRAARDECIELVLVQARDVELREPVEADRHAGDAHLGARALVGPDRVLGGDGRVDVGLLPPVFGVLVDGRNALDIGNSAYAYGQVLCGGEGSEGSGEREERGSEDAHWVTLSCWLARNSGPC